MRTRLSNAVFLAAAVCFTANCALGTAVAARIVDTGRFRWVHHALYIVTVASTVLAVSSALWGRDRQRSRRAALALSPALVPLAVIPFAGTRTRRHPAIALSAAPFFMAGALTSRR